MNTSHVTARTRGQNLQQLRLVLHPKSAFQMFGESPSCELCQTDEFLVYERVQAVRKRTTTEPILWDVDCWCGKCETFYGFQTIHPPKGAKETQAVLQNP